MKRQRGFAELWLILIIGAGALVAAGAMYAAGYKHGSDSKTEFYEPKLAAAKAEKALAVSANEGLQRDLENIKKEVDSCKTNVEKLKADSDEAIKKLGPIIEESKERAKAMASLVARFQAASKPSKPVPPDQQCEAARATLGDLSEQITALEALGLAPAKANVNLRISK